MTAFEECQEYLTQALIAVARATDSRGLMIKLVPSPRDVGSVYDVLQRLVRDLHPSRQFIRFDGIGLSDDPMGRLTAAHHLFLVSNLFMHLQRYETYKREIERRETTMSANG